MHGRISASFIVAVLLLGLWPLRSFSQTSPPIHSIRLGPPAAALAYWTPERLQTAVPANLPVLEDALALPAPAANSGASIFTRFAVFPFLYNGDLGNTCCYPYSTIGKLFALKPGGPGFSCTASVVHPHLLLTARHCVYDLPTHQFFKNVTFYPGWYVGHEHPGPNPFLGTWAGQSIATFATNASIKYDIAFIQTYDDTGGGCGGSTGHPIEEFTGYLGALSSPNEDYFDRQWNQFGYPGEPPFNGFELIEVQSGIHFRGSGKIVVEAGNDMTGGASGGPWIFGFDTTGGGNPGGNFANGVNHGHPAGYPGVMQSPRFLADNFDALFQTAKDCPP
jgi:V8-like Glu-specific endopeptidase